MISEQTENRASATTIVKENYHMLDHEKNQTPCEKHGNVIIK